MESFKDRIKFFREKNNMTKSELARRVGVSPSYITMLESGEKTNPSLEVQFKIAKVLGISGKNLFPNDENLTYEEEWDYVNSKEFENLTATYILQNLIDEKENIVIPFIKYINDTYLKSKYDIDKILYTSTDNLMNSNCDYTDLKLLLIDIIEIRLNHYDKKQKNENNL